MCRRGNILIYFVDQIEFFDLLIDRKEEEKKKELRGDF